jgi:sugar phosphate isomerase/epimerase
MEMKIAMEQKVRFGIIGAGTIRLSGFADEAASGIDGQIEATRSLGWPCIEARSIDGVNIHDLPDADFEAVRRKLDLAGLRIDCFGSTIANWNKRIDEPFAETLAVVERAIRRMRALDVPLVRIMSYAVLRDASGAYLPTRKKRNAFAACAKSVPLPRRRNHPGA